MKQIGIKKEGLNPKKKTSRADLQIQKSKRGFLVGEKKEGDLEKIKRTQRPH